MNKRDRHKGLRVKGLEVRKSQNLYRLTCLEYERRLVQWI